MGDADRFCARCGSAYPVGGATPQDALIGRTIGGAYVVLELVGVGGMGRVYRAEQSMLGRTVAIKVVHPHLLGDEQSVARFYSEARTASRLNHPNSVGVIDFGRTEDGVLYLVMEYLRGKDLARVMHEEGPLPFPRIVDILCGVLAALGEAHSLDVVHRDLKPENVLLEPGRKGADSVKVVDFGLAKLMGNSRSSSITSPGLVCGTPDYMSPEQGRGEETDGRGDLYSVGVLLFELLADRLPYVDDTPTKVVLRHMTDPVPDPRAVAPSRDIPAALASVCMRAMAKVPDERFQSAEAMAEALQRALGSQRALAPGLEAPCSTCGQPSPVMSRFCAECGARLTVVFVSAQHTPLPATRSEASARCGVPIGRTEEIALLEALRAQASGAVVWAHVQGDAGVGKTRLLSWVASLAAGEGDQVALGRPHPSGALVPYAPIRTLVETLLDAAPERLQQLVGRDAGVFVDALTRAGLAELLAPTGLAGTNGKARPTAVAAMLATAVRVAAGRSRTGRVVLLVDDLAACDELSREVLAELPRLVGDAALLLVTASQRPAPPALARGATSIALAGLGPSDAARLLGGGAVTPVPAAADACDIRYLPLYLEQLRALGLTLETDAVRLPMRLADAVLLRLERLTLPARRMLQAAAVLGERAPVAMVRAMVDERDRVGLEALCTSGLVRLEGDSLGICSLFVRDLVAMSVPAEARRRLHERALELAIEAEAPLEVRAEHAYRAGELVGALVLLERMGDRALARGDAATAVLALRRGLDLARRTLLETGDTTLDRAIATFSRKLGDALDLSGDSAGADGVVREALDLTPRDGLERARMLLVLGRVAARRQRHRDAVRLLGEALDLATRHADLRVAAEVQAALGRVRREEGDERGAAGAHRRAVELLAQANAPLARQASALVELAEVLLDLGELEHANAHLERAARLGVEADAPAVVASALGTLASVDELSGRTAQAASRYREAASLAARAGDAEARERWERAAMERRRSGVLASA